ncbi:hypothetical protein TRFO_28826 [Tritrichomonas foetus]|uniref:Uncharacterized protein n=1 Tax=Tritrichomonas foetus TaxID=1144522 RepID=A0A1J4K2H4_9EUKA|nr:hypothetical protein TRFO_28826 [Tritrichomonas foetus]|eukprot:OHT03693.1 hypothetical protein TRFO_28826 [Tritrichomonas foetus]
MRKKPRFPQKTAITPSPSRKKSASEKYSQQKLRIVNLISDLKRTHECGNIETNDLKLIHIYVRDVSPQLFGCGNYVEARNLILIGEEVDNELEMRGETQNRDEAPSPKKVISRPQTRSSSPKSSKAMKALSKYDDETIELVQKMQNRHDQLREDYAAIWEKNMQIHYFMPSKELQNMRQKALDLKQKGDKKKLQDLLQQCEDKELIETEEAQRKYEHDFLVAQQKVEDRHNRELERFLIERLQKRNRMTGQSGYNAVRAVSQCVTRKNSPRNSRKNSPGKSSKMPPLISYTNCAHKIENIPTTPVTPSRKKRRRYNHRSDIPSFRQETVQNDIENDFDPEMEPIEMPPEKTSLPRISKTAPRTHFNSSRLSPL